MNNKEITLKDLADPHELSRLSIPQCEKICGEIRENIIRTVMKNGGHLSSNLGTVELTVAIHRVFRSPADKIVWDVGHQAYAHKLLTGRWVDFPSLRKKGGISGFCRPAESEHDAFISGHSSTSISAALGMAEAMRLNGDKHHAVAVIGDGAFTGGLAYEGLNNAGKSNNNLIVILNHNDMSISKNVGAFAKYLTSIRGNTAYLNAKKRVEHILGNTPFVGEPIKKVIKTSKSALKSVLYHSTMFEDMGFVYLGPIDGHNISELEDALRAAKKLRRPVFVHVNTVKGKGFRPAEINPGAFHAIPSCGYRKSNPNNVTADSFSETAGKLLCRIAAKDENVCAITAAMKYATGMQHFAARYPERFFDVGIAEQHAVTFAAGLAKGGKLPFFAVYSSFLQRSYDQLIHDASIDRIHMVLGIDRAGFVGEDGETHQGLFDVPMLLTVPGVTVYSPSTYGELEMCMESAFFRADGVAAVRYPKGAETVTFGAEDTDSFSITKNGSRRLAVSYGRIVHNLYAAAETADCDVLKLAKIFPIDGQAAELCMNYDEIYFFEEGSRRGGVGEYLMTELYGKGYRGKFTITAADGFACQASAGECLDECGLSREKMAEILNGSNIRTEDKIET
ncbi:MAG: 1-deoxy-D-xylulose-5-phosphate synthase [Oscillospiraceae bacterium]|nr:1-deoxy-D-xylulose-5-phosphate synthase [Oscillospiraceae bacterium]